MQIERPWATITNNLVVHLLVAISSGLDYIVRIMVHIMDGV